MLSAPPAFVLSQDQTLRFITQQTRIHQAQSKIVQASYTGRKQSYICHQHTLKRAIQTLTTRVLRKDAQNDTTPPAHPSILPTCQKIMRLGGEPHRYPDLNFREKRSGPGDGAAVVERCIWPFPPPGKKFFRTFLLR